MSQPRDARPLSLGNRRGKARTQMGRVRDLRLVQTDGLLGARSWQGDISPDGEGNKSTPVSCRYARTFFICAPAA